jgi:hypothetical protein
MVFADYQVGQVLWSVLWFTMFFIWIWLLITVFADIFRSHDLSGWVKALWVIGVIIFPFLGVLLYLIIRGGSMQKRALEQQQKANQQFQQYVQSVAAPGSGSSAATELARLADLHAAGSLTDAEFATAKAKVIG